jgi:hypothetical protein
MLTLEKLERTLHIRQTIDELQEELHSIYSGLFAASTPSPAKRRGRKKGKVGKAKTAVFGAVNAPVKKKTRKMSAAGRAKIAAAQKARWAKRKPGKA